MPKVGRVEGTVTIEGARIVFRNFEGKEGPYNRAGDRNFCVLLDPKFAAELADDGWNVKNLRAREDGDIDQPYLQISVGFGARPPKIAMITSKGRTDLDEETAALLDWADFENVDLIFRPYNWEVGGRGGVKAYLKTMFVTIREDELELKYGDVAMASDWAREE